jgi:DNA invertase Pin-like site-specific DNA recombinase
MGLTDAEIFVDHGISGWTDPTVRPIYKEMMKRVCDTNKEKVDTIIFSEFSRLGRNVKESMYELLRLEHDGITIQSLSQVESFINQIPMPWQMSVLTGMMIGADIERQHHKERTQWAVNKVKATGSKSGKPMGRPRVEIDWSKIKETMDTFKVKEDVARRICGYVESTYYKAKKQRAGSASTSLIKKEGGVNQ